MLKTLPNKLSIWVWQRNDFDNIIKDCKEAGIGTVLVKMADTFRYPYFSSQRLKDLVSKFHDNGLLLGAWNYSVVDTFPQQVQTIASLFADGIDLEIIDAESEWEFYKGDPDEKAIEFMQSLRSAVGSEATIGHAPFACPDFHSRFAYTSFNTYCDLMLDQSYWTEFGWSVDYTMQITDQQWQKYYSKRPQISTPRCPVAPTYGRNNYGPSVKGPITASDMDKFLNHYLPISPMVSLYSYDACHPDIMKYLKQRNQGVPFTNTPSPIQVQIPTQVQTPTPIQNLIPQVNQPDPIAVDPAPTQDLPNNPVQVQAPAPIQIQSNNIISFIGLYFTQILNFISQILKWFQPK